MCKKIHMFDHMYFGFYFLAYVLWIKNSKFEKRHTRESNSKRKSPHRSASHLKKGREQSQVGFFDIIKHTLEHAFCNLVGEFILFKIFFLFSVFSFQIKFVKRCSRMRARSHNFLSQEQVEFGKIRSDDDVLKELFAFVFENATFGLVIWDIVVGIQTCLV